jgi:hypothetical protein
VHRQEELSGGIGRAAGSSHQFFASDPGVFLVGSGVSGLEAPVFFPGSGAGTTTIAGAFGSYGIAGAVKSEPGGGASTALSASTGVPAKSKTANVKLIAVDFI